jgi:hypothetical protein
VLRKTDRLCAIAVQVFVLKWENYGRRIRCDLQRRVPELKRLLFLGTLAVNLDQIRILNKNILSRSMDYDFGTATMARGVGDRGTKQNLDFLSCTINYNYQLETTSPL